MIRRNGRQTWRNVHVTARARVDDLIDVDNATPSGQAAEGFDLLLQAARDLDALVREAAEKGKRVRALGSGWALTDIAVTDGWLVNTKALNGCFDLADRFFEPGYPEAKRRYLVVAQCGISVAELNVHLEVTATPGFPRALKTAGIGAGQTIAGAVSGNTHGAAINFGSMPDFVVGLQLVTGSGRSVWLERASEPVLNDEFVTRLEADRIRDDELFEAAVVGLGAFGIITAVAIETDPLYQLAFPPKTEIRHDALRDRLDQFDFDDPADLYHYEFIFDPYSRSETAVQTWAARVPFEAGHEPPDPVWIIRSDQGFAVGDHAPVLLADAPVLTPRQKTALQFGQYREQCMLGDTRCTPGQAFTATITYLEGFTESAIGVSIDDAATMFDVGSRVIRDMKLSTIAQVRVVHPSRTLLGFTTLGPKTAVFDFALPDDDRFPAFERTLLHELAASGVAYRLHWSKNSGIDRTRLLSMYGRDRVDRWMQARRRVFGGDTALMRVFDNEHLARAGLAAEDQLAPAGHHAEDHDA